MSFLKSWKFMVIVFVVFTAVVVGLITWGVATHSEAGMMETTPGWARSDFPLRVCPAAYVPPVAPAVRAVSDAVGDINSQLGFRAMEVECQASAIMVMVGVPSEAGWTDPGGNATVRHHACAIETCNTGTAEVEQLVLQHELLHCLGLTHDDFSSSIMRRVQSATPRGQFPPSITDSDRALLRGLFAPL